MTNNLNIVIENSWSEKLGVGKLKKTCGHGNQLNVPLKFPDFEPRSAGYTYHDNGSNNWKNPYGKTFGYSPFSYDGFRGEIDAAIRCLKIRNDIIDICFGEGHLHWFIIKKVDGKIIVEY